MSCKLRVSNGSIVEFVTIGELADMCGRSRDALVKLIDRGIIPDANFRTPSITIRKGVNAGGEIEGYRLYSKEFLAKKLAEFFTTNVKQGRQITAEQRRYILDLFQKERELLSK